MQVGSSPPGSGSAYRPGARWPRAEQLEYVQKLATAVLLSFGLALLIVFAVRNPRTVVPRVLRATEGGVG